MIKSRSGKRHTADHYPTPHPVCESALTKLADLRIQPNFILDVGAGDGAWGKACRQQFPGVEIVGVEVRELPRPAEYDIWHVSRFEDLKAGCYDLILGNPPFRYAHLGAIAFVALESVIGVACPLTVWEDALRGAGPQGKSFIGRWVSYFLYYDLPPWAFTALYVLFALAVATTLFWIPPRRRQA